MRKALLLLLILASANITFAQHQSFYSQYIYSGLLINPAYAGSQDALSVAAAYRNQWTGFDGAPKNLSLALHTPLKNKKTNIGLLVANENFGLSNQTGVNLAYAYRIKSHEHSLSFGLQAGIDLLKTDWNQVKTTDKNDPIFTSGLETRSIPTFGAGVYYKGTNCYAGLAVPTLYKLDSKSSFSPYAFNLYSGMLIRLKNEVVIKPSALVKYIKNSPIQWDVTTTFYLSKIMGVGFGYRSNDAVYAFLDIKINDQFNLGYAYDFTTSQLKNYSSGSHEILLRYLFKYNVNSKSVRYF